MASLLGAGYDSSDDEKTTSSQPPATAAAASAAKIVAAPEVNTEVWSPALCVLFLDLCGWRENMWRDLGI